MKNQSEMELSVLKWLFHLLETSQVLTGKNLAQQIGVNFYYLLYRSLHSLSPPKDENSLILFLIANLSKLLPSTVVDSLGIPFCAFSSLMTFLQDPDSEYLNAENIQAANSVCSHSRFPLNLPLILLLLQPTPQVFSAVLTCLKRSSISGSEKILLEGENLDKFSNICKSLVSTNSVPLGDLCKSLKEESKSFEVTPLSLACILNLHEHFKILIAEGALLEMVFITFSNLSCV